MALFALSAAGNFGCEQETRAPDRGPIGKADLLGSCADTSCDGEGSEGNCFCDDACVTFGDCCADRQSQCARFQAITYNVGLAHGAVPFAEERLPLLTDELARSAADVICVQELWLDEDFEAMKSGLAEAFPFSFREVTEGDGSHNLACALELFDVQSLNSCVNDRCKANGISTFECVADPCKAEYDEIDDTCKLCLAANTTDPFTCLGLLADRFGNDGRNGLALFSRHPIEDARYVAFDTALLKRGVLVANVAGIQIECTHLSADLASVPYPDDSGFSSWQEEHRSEIPVLADAAGDRCTLLLGDLNSGPAGDSVDPELADNYRALIDAGFDEFSQDDAPCTFCSENPIAGGESDTRIDHGLLRGCPQSTVPRYERIFDQPIEIVDSEGQSHPARLSDHYGVSVEL